MFFGKKTLLGKMLDTANGQYHCIHKNNNSEFVIN